MTDKDMKKTETEAKELKDEQLDDVKGGFSHEVIQPRTVIDKDATKKDSVSIDFQDGNDVIKPRTTEEHLRDSHPGKGF